MITCECGSVSSERNIGSVPIESIYFFFFLDVFYTHQHSNYAVTRPLFNYMFQELSLLH